jgi:hypothetical protein
VLGKGLVVGGADADAAEEQASEGRIALLDRASDLRKRLVDELVGFCAQLMRHYAESGTSGLSLGDLEALTPPAAKAETLAGLSAEVQPAEPPPVHVDAAPADEATASERGSDTAIAVPVFLAVVGDVGPDHGREWSRARATVRALDKHLAGESEGGGGLNFLVSLVEAQPGRATPLEPAGSLRRRDVARPDGLGDFAQHLSSLHAALDRGQEDLRRRRLAQTKPVVVLLAVEAPPADAVSSELHERLASRASVIWVAPGEVAGMLNPVYAEGSAVVAAHKRALGEIYEILLAGIGRSG